MKRVLFVIGMCLPLFSYSQRLHVNLFGGFANYQGDLQDKPFTLEQSNGAFGAGIKYDLNGHFSLRTGIMYGIVRADDKENSASLQPRNLSFKSRVLEGNLLLEYNLLDLNYRKFTPYVFGGVGVFHFNPYAYDSLGRKVFLKPLSTEGQGLAQYPDRKPYKRTQFALPFGGGIKLRVTENVVLGYEVGMRKTFTDYLDDVSKTYVDAAILAAERGPKAVEMSYRGGELKGGNPLYPIAGTKRGSEQFKDWYYFHGITVSIGLNTGGGRNKYDCPRVN